MAIQNEEQALQALDQLTAELATPPKADLSQICATYKTIKPFLEGVLSLVARIPVVGQKIVAEIQFLITVADLACPG